jgi:uncharacterized RmlC-like cupin family protein
VADDGFHPDLQQSERLVRNRVHHVKSSDIDADTAQSEGMQRFAAISGRTVGSEKLWMGETHVHPLAMSANHHHGESETAIFVFIPPYLPHREENPSPDEPATVVIARSTQEAIVVNLPELYAL